MEVDKLVRMVNQIAANLEQSDKEQTAGAVCDHLRRFWSPPMRALIVEHHARGAAGLSECAALAVAKLAEQTRAA